MYFWYVRCNVKQWLQSVKCSREYLGIGNKIEQQNSALCCTIAISQDLIINYYLNSNITPSFENILLSKQCKLKLVCIEIPTVKILLYQTLAWWREISQLQSTFLRTSSHSECKPNLEESAKCQYIIFFTFCVYFHIMLCSLHLQHLCEYCTVYSPFIVISE